jgi:integrase/recombinase XerD
VKQPNKCVGRIAKSVGINEKVSSYVTRHSWATIAKNSGTSLEFLSEALGHSSTKDSEGYLKSLEKSMGEKHSEKMGNAIYYQKAV